MRKTFVKQSLMLVVLFLMLAILLLMSGCFFAVSVNPIYTTQDIVSDDAFLGYWVQMPPEEQSPMSLTVEKEPDDGYGYNLTVCRDGIANVFLGHLVKLDQELYLDCYPKIDALMENINYFMAFHLVRVHSIAKITIDQNRLELRFLSNGFLEDVILREKLQLEYTVITEWDDQILLTGSTAEVQKLIKQYSEELFSGDVPNQFERAQNPFEQG